MSLWGKTGNFRSPNGASPTIISVQEAGSQTFKRGDFVVLASNKATALATHATLSSAEADFTTNKVVGMALENASGTENTLIDVVLCDVNTEFEINVGNETLANSVTAASMVGQSYRFAHWLLTTTSANVDRNGEIYTGVAGYAINMSDTTVSSTGGFTVTQVPEAGVFLGKVWGKFTSLARTEAGK